MARNLAFSFRQKPRKIGNRFYFTGQNGTAELVSGDTFESQHLPLDGGLAGEAVQQLPVSISRLWVDQKESPSMPPNTFGTLEFVSDEPKRFAPLTKMKKGVLIGVSDLDAKDILAAKSKEPAPSEPDEPEFVIPRNNDFWPIQVAAIGFTTIMLIFTLLKYCSRHL